MERLSVIFKALSDPLRLRILRQLFSNGKEAYGEELANALGIPAYQVSRHLKVLKTTGLIRERKAGRWVYYSLAKENGHGQLLTALRRLLADSSAADGNSLRAAPRSRTRDGSGAGKRSRPDAALDITNWDQGPAIPGML